MVKTPNLSLNLFHGLSVPEMLPYRSTVLRAAFNILDGVRGLSGPADRFLTALQGHENPIKWNALLAFLETPEAAPVHAIFEKRWDQFVRNSRLRADERLARLIGETSMPVGSLTRSFQETKNPVTAGAKSVLDSKDRSTLLTTLSDIHDLCHRAENETHSTVTHLDHLIPHLISLFRRYRSDYRREPSVSWLAAHNLWHLRDAGGREAVETQLGLDIDDINKGFRRNKSASLSTT
jgi:hypothetical protein